MTLVPRTKLILAVMHSGVLTTPSGWTLIATSGPFTGSSVNRYASLLQKSYDDPGDASAVVTLTLGTSGRASGLIVPFTSIINKPLSIIASTVNGANAGSAITTAPMPVVTATKGGQAAVALMTYTLVNGTPALAPPPGYEPISNGGATNSRFCLCWKQLADGESTGGNFTLGSAATGYAGVAALIG